MYSLGMLGRHLEKTFFRPTSRRPLSTAPSLVMYRADSSPQRSRSMCRACGRSGRRAGRTGGSVWRRRRRREWCWAMQLPPAGLRLSESSHTRSTHAQVAGGSHLSRHVCVVGHRCGLGHRRARRVLRRRRRAARWLGRVPRSLLLLVRFSIGCCCSLLLAELLLRVGALGGVVGRCRPTARARSTLHVRRMAAAGSLKESRDLPHALSRQPGQPGTLSRQPAALAPPGLAAPALRGAPRRPCDADAT